MSAKIYLERTDGSGPLTLLLLHGLGANGAMWNPLIPHIKRDWNGPCLVPDLPGHGRSDWNDSYSFGTFAAAVAQAAANEGPIVIIGHSLGGAVGALLASGWFGLDVRMVLALSVKTLWSADELARFQGLARQAPRLVANREEALEKYVRASGLSGIVAADDPMITAGVAQVDGGARFAADPRTVGSTGRQVDVLLRSALCPVHFATGADDKMAPAEQMFPFDGATTVIPAAGHNVHVEQPGAIWSLFRELVTGHEIEAQALVGEQVQ